MRHTTVLSERQQTILQFLAATDGATLGTIRTLVRLAEAASDGPRTFVAEVEDLIRFHDTVIGLDAITRDDGEYADLKLLITLGLVDDAQSGRLYVLTRSGADAAQRLGSKRRVILRPEAAHQTKAFVASAFGHADVDRLFRSELQPAIAKVGLHAYRVDRAEPEATITDAILEEIRQARVVVADLSYARPSVYFEVGYAAALGLPIVLTCRANHLKSANDAKRVHFDLQQYKISFWHLQDRRIQWPARMAPLQRLRTVLKNSSSRPTA